MPFFEDHTGYYAASFYDMVRDLFLGRLFGSRETKELYLGTSLQWQVDLAFHLYSKGYQEFSQEDARIYQAIIWMFMIKE